MLHHHGNTGNLVEVLDLWATSKSSCASESHMIEFHHNGHLHDLIHAQYLWHHNDLLDLLDDGHCLCATWMVSGCS